MIQRLTADENAALVTISILASVLAVLGIRKLASAWFGLNAGFMAGLIFVCSPLAWFHGTVALTYIVEACFSVWCGYCFWRARQSDGRLVVSGAMLLGLSAGFRPSSALFLGPLFLFSLLRATRSRQILACLTLGGAVLLWAIPMVRQSGGVAAYWSSLLLLWRMQGGKETVFNSSPVSSIVRSCTIVGIAAVCFGAAWLPVFGQRLQRYHSEAPRFTTLWLTPGLLFFTFIFLRWINSGYLLVLSPPVFAWLGYYASEWLRGVMTHKKWRLGAALTACTANILIFLLAPIYCSYASIRTFESELRQVLKGIREAGRPESTLLVGFDSHFLGYRHPGFYLPEYHTVQYPEVRYPAGKRVFAMVGAQTSLLAKVPTQQYDRLLFCPLPSDDLAYAKYANGVIAHLPPGDLVHVRVAGRDYVTAPIRDLGLLFPATADYTR